MKRRVKRLSSITAKASICAVLLNLPIYAKMTAITAVYAALILMLSATDSLMRTYLNAATQATSLAFAPLCYRAVRTLITAMI